MQLEKKHYLFHWLLLLTIFFIVWQIRFLFFQPVGPVVLNLIFHSENFHLPIRMLPQVFIFIGVQLSLYFCFLILVWGVTRLASQFLKLTWKKTCVLGYLIWGISVVAILLANQLFYSASAFSDFLDLMIPISWSAFILGGISVLLSFVVLLALAQLIKIFWKMRFITSIAISLFIVMFFFLNIHAPLIAKKIHNSKPNVIIIGLDAVRPDHLSYYGYSLNLAPHINQFLSQSTNFTMSITPLARTFVAWSSILTGNYPKHDGIRFNLWDQSHLHLDNSLAAVLKRHGYQTIYASDDWRFSNMSHRFGFDKLIGIKPGANDFFLGSINDFPLSNLIINTRLGEWLFPYSYGNRAAALTYMPSSFTKLLNERLHYNQEKPLFLAVHFTLPHWPYIWRRLKYVRHGDFEIFKHLYDLSIWQLDGQFKMFMGMLNKRHLLDNAIVIVLSDHGEAFMLPGDRIISRKSFVRGPLSDKKIFDQASAIRDEEHKMNISIGHGTDVLSLSQCRNVLAFRLFGQWLNYKKNTADLVSLIDIKPTVLDLLGISYLHIDGKSLRTYINGDEIALKPRMIYTETGFSPSAVQISAFVMKNAVYEGLEIYHIDPKTTHLLLRQSAVSKLMKAKERAVYFKNWVFAFYPNKEKGLLPILANRLTGQWTDDFSTEFAKKSPLKKMSSAIRQFYGNELSY